LEIDTVGVQHPARTAEQVEKEEEKKKKKNKNKKNKNKNKNKNKKRRKKKKYLDYNFIRRSSMCFLEHISTKKQDMPLNDTLLHSKQI
jgi:hypothetical protein